MIGYVKIWRDFRSITRIPLGIISLIIVSLNLFFYLSYLYYHRIKVLSSNTFLAFGISCLKMFTRSSDWIFNPMRRYTGLCYPRVQVNSTGLNFAANIFLQPILYYIFYITNEKYFTWTCLHTHIFNFLILFFHDLNLTQTFFM